MAKKPSAPLPGDVLTPEQVNARLERAVEQMNAALQEQSGRITAVATALAELLKGWEKMPDMIEGMVVEAMKLAPKREDKGRDPYDVAWPPLLGPAAPNAANPAHGIEPEFAPIGYGVRIIGPEQWVWYRLAPNTQQSGQTYATYSDAVAAAHAAARAGKKT